MVEESVTARDGKWPRFEEQSGEERREELLERVSDEKLCSVMSVMIGMVGMIGIAGIAGLADMVGKDV